MSSFLVFNNIHLGLELFGAIIFFIIAWLFFEGYLLKKDIWGFGRFGGFAFISAYQIFHAIYSTAPSLTPLFYGVGMILLILSYALENLPSRPDGSFVFGFLPPFYFFGRPAAQLFLNLALFLVLIKRYFKDIERLLKPLIFGFLLFAASSLVSFGSVSETFNTFWFIEHGLKFFGFLAVGFWGWRLLSLRMREEALLIFFGISLFIALLVTTTFSAVFLKKIEEEAKFNLSASTKIFGFYLESLKSKALSSAQIVAGNSDFISAFHERDLADLEKISRNLTGGYDLQFLTAASTKGNVFFKLNFPATRGENVLEENASIEALEGKPVVAVSFSGSEGLSVRAAVPVFDRGKIIGVIISGYLLNDHFLEAFNKVSGFQSSIFRGDAVLTSTVFKAGDKFAESLIENVLKKRTQLVGSAEFFGEEVIGSFLPLEVSGKEQATLAITTTPGELLVKAQNTNRLTMIIVFLIVLALVLPLYRFTVFLTS